MIARQALQSATQTLGRAGIPDACVEAELLLEHVLGISKTGLYTEPEKSLTSEQAEHLSGLVRRRLNREPTAYILDHCEFYGLDFRVDDSTLIPRPETELVVEKAAELAHRARHPGRPIVVADIGTGCGAIAVSLALALPQARVYATDISSSALRVAEANVGHHSVGGRVKLLLGDLLEPLPERVDVVVANLPYVRDCEFNDLSAEIREFEPRIALAGGEDGLDRIRQMLGQMPGRLGEGGCFILEIGHGQQQTVNGLIDRHFPAAVIEWASDLGDIPRVVSVVPVNSGYGGAR